MWGCAGLCALGATLAWSAIITEATRLLGTTLPSVRLVGSCGAVGLIGGLLLPRRVIRRRLERSAGTAEAAGPAADLEFAAALTGLLILLLGGLEATLGMLSAALVDYQRFLTECFIHPPAVTRLLLWLPMCLGLGLTGMASALVLTALHAWCGMLRAHTGPKTALWAAMLLATAIGSLLSACPERCAWLRIGALLATFCAALLAVLRPTGDSGGSTSTIATVRVQTVWLPLLIVGATTSVVATVLLDALWEADRSARPTTPTTALVCLAGLVALPLLRLVPTGQPAHTAVALVSLALAALAGLALRVTTDQGLAAGLSVVVLTSLLGAANLTIVTRCVTRIVGRVQPVLAWCGVAAATGLLIGLLLYTPAPAADGGALRFLPTLALAGAALLGPLARLVPGGRALWLRWPVIPNAH